MMIKLFKKNNRIPLQRKIQNINILSENRKV